MAGLCPDQLGELIVPHCPDPLLRLWEGRAMGNGGRAGRRWEGTEGRGGTEGNERKERRVVPHRKINPGCATDQ